MKYCCFTCLVEKFIVKSFGIFLFCYKKGILVASWEEKTVCWNGFELMEHVLAPVFWIVGDTDRLWKHSNHLDISEAETTQTNFFSSNQLVCCWFTCGIVVHPSFYSSIWSIFGNCKHGIPPCWRFHSVSFHLHSTLGVISVERVFAVAWPYRHRTLKLRAYICAIATPWIMSAMITVLVFTLINVWGLLIFCPAAPLIVMCLAYYVIWKKQRSAMGNQNQSREAKLAKTLFLITGTSILTWLPFQILNIVLYFGVIGNFSYSTFTFLLVRVLQFSNSLVNVIIYPFRIPGFRKTLCRMLRCHQRFDDRAPTPARSESVVSLRRLKSSECSPGNPNQEIAL